MWKIYKTAALSEGIEEVADNIITNIRDSVQLGDQSEISQLIRSYKQQGYSKSSAVVKAGVEKYVVDSLIGFLTGATAGGMTTYGVNKINTIKQSLAESDRLGIIHKAYAAELDRLIAKTDSNTDEQKTLTSEKETNPIVTAYSKAVNEKIEEYVEKDKKDYNTEEEIVLHNYENETNAKKYRIYKRNL